MALPEFKVVVLGEKGVGKSCLVRRYIEGMFSVHQQSTIGAFYLTKKCTTADGTSIKMQVWDTAGQERFRSMAPMYYRNANAAIVVFDITTEDSFHKMKDWVEELKQHQVAESIILAIACNKCDLEENRVVSRARSQEYARKAHALLYDTSAKENVGVDDLFKMITEEMVKKRREDGWTGTDKSGGAGTAGQLTTNKKLQLVKEKETKKGCC